MIYNKQAWWRLTPAPVVASCILALAGCNDQETHGGNPFVSDAPNAGYNGVDEGGDAAGGGGAEEPGTDGEKAIVEADILQIDGNKLYALSQYSGLSVIDISDPADLKMLGHHRIQGVPFEMYLKDGVIHAMFSSFGHWQYDEGDSSYSYVSSSHIEALDVSDPAEIVSIGSFDLPGEISDSRIVGEVLYAVSYENGYCWDCANQPTTTVTSIQLADPTDIHVVDTVAFADEDKWGWGWRRSVSVTQDRMYVAGIEWDGDSNGHSTIQIVDISDPGGDLGLGASVLAAGQIESRWQMDEKDGVLRVVSQPGVWWTEDVPIVQTFQIASSTEVTPLGALPLVLPVPERLRSVRFDGDRAYAITAEQTDPLFVIDLADPAAPVQMGELEMPGWVYHMEPRGNRIYALGFDNTDPAGSMNVSLFDVEDMANPTMLARIAFGGAWSWAPEDQDRIHKAFKIDETLGTIFVPYSAWTWDETKEGGCSAFDSGIQLIDFTQDTLTKRGAAPLHGFARRAFVHDGSLFTMSDAEVASYDIADKDAPNALDALPISVNVTRAIAVGDHIVRISADWWTSEARLDIVPRQDPDQTVPLGSLSLSDAIEGDTCYAWSYFYNVAGFSLQNRAVLVWSTYRYFMAEDGSYSQENQSQVAVVNIDDPTAPFVEGNLVLPEEETWYGYGGVLDGGEAVVLAGDRLFMQRVWNTSWDATADEHATVKVVSLADPAAPAVESTLALPDGIGHTRLVKSGNVIASSRWVPVPDMPGKVMFFVDRIVSTPGGATVASPVNVPGSLVGYDAGAAHALLLDYQKSEVANTTAADCYQNWGWDASFQGEGSSEVGTCTYTAKIFKLADLADPENVQVLDGLAAQPASYLDRALPTSSRVFVGGYGPSDHGWTYSHFVFGDIGADQIDMVEVAGPENDYLYPMAAKGSRLVLASYSDPGISVLDATDMDNAEIERRGDVNGWIWDVTIDGDQALCSSGPWGLQVIDLN